MRTKTGQKLTYNAIWAVTLTLLLAAPFTFIGCKTTTPPPAPQSASSMEYEEGVPGGVIVDIVEVSARVTAVDTVNRKVTLMRSDGAEHTVKVGPEAVNFDQVRVGDLLNITLTEELVVFLGEEGTSAPDETVALIARARKGEKPAGVVAAATQVTATVVGIDQAHRTATLRTEDGDEMTLPVRPDIDLSKRKVGEKVVFQVTEMIAISIEKQ